jgi:polysaccharide export outer membrane protein
MKSRFFLSASALFFLVSTVGAQSPEKPPTSAGDAVTTGRVIVSPGEQYTIGPRDVLEIKIEDAPELSGTLPVSPDGTIPMNYLGRVKAEGYTPEQLAKSIADSLRGRYLINPQVVVLVKQNFSRTYFIQGSVERPGVYQIEGRPSLLMLITVAGGPKDNHGSTAFILREVKASPAAASSERPANGAGEDAGPDYQVITVNINGLFRGRLDQNIYVEPGDLVTIPPADVFYVAGEVKAPNSFQLKEGITLRQAIALAQGPTENAKTGEGVIFREDHLGRVQEIKVDIGAILKGKKDDVPLQANDLVMVPNSRGKTIGNAILKAFGMSAAQRGVIR